MKTVKTETRQRVRHAPSENRVSSGKQVSSEKKQPGGVSLGKLVGFDELGRPLVSHDFNSLHTPEPALSLESLGEADLGADVAVSRLENAPVDMIIMGVIKSPAAMAVQEGVSVADEDNPVLEIDGEAVQLSGEKEITLRCGKSSITLTRSGKILIKGEHILSRASGSNRILGGAIQLN